MFQVPFEHYPAPPGFDKVKKELLQVFADDDNSSHRMTPDGRVLEDLKTDFFHNDKNHIFPPYYNIVTKALNPYLKTISDQVGFQVEITTMWYQQAMKGQYHQTHNHGAVGMSCVWYLEFDPAVHTATTFYCPFADPLTGDLMQNTPRVREGDFVVFPAFLLHEQQANDSDKRRTIVSFNLAGAPKPKFYKHTAWHYFWPAI